jgi:polyhydroxyalkanoate synthesis regulator phasin
MSEKKAKKSAKKKKKDDGLIKDMTELVRTSVFAGLGMVLLGEEKVEEWAKKIARENKLSTKDMNSFIRDLKKQGSDARKDIEKRVKDLVDEIVPSGKKKSSGKSSKKSKARSAAKPAVKKVVEKKAETPVPTSSSSEGLL